MSCDTHVKKCQKEKTQTYLLIEERTQKRTSLLKKLLKNVQAY